MEELEQSSAEISSSHDISAISARIPKLDCEFKEDSISREEEDVTMFWHRLVALETSFAEDHHLLTIVAEETAKDLTGLKESVECSKAIWERELVTTEKSLEYSFDNLDSRVREDIRCIQIRLQGVIDDVGKAKQSQKPTSEGSAAAEDNSKLVSAITCAIGAQIDGLVGKIDGLDASIQAMREEFERLLRRKADKTEMQRLLVHLSARIPKSIPHR